MYTHKGTHAGEKKELKHLGIRKLSFGVSKKKTIKHHIIMFTDFVSSTCFFIKQKMTGSKKKSKLNT